MGDDGSNRVAITEMTTPVRGSVRFGTMYDIQNRLYMFTGPIPTSYYIGKVSVTDRKGKPITTQMAKLAQSIMNDAYDLDPDIRGKTWVDLAIFLRSALGLEE